MLTTKELPENERPYEKCEKLGCAYLSDAELLAVILRCGTKNQKAVDLAHQILKLAASVSEVTGLYGINYLTGEQLKRIHGIGRVKAIQIQCVLELSRRLSKAKAHLGLECTDPGNNRRILYGRHALSASGTADTAHAQYKKPYDLRCRYIQRLCGLCRNFSKGYFYRGYAP